MRTYSRLSLTLSLLAALQANAAQTIVLPGQTDAGLGTDVSVLSNGIIAAIDPEAVNAGEATGELRLYTPKPTLLATFKGSSVGDFNDAFLLPLPGGRALAVLPRWDSEGAVDAGRVVVIHPDGRTSPIATGQTAGDRLGIDRDAFLVDEDGGVLFLSRFANDGRGAATYYPPDGDLLETLDATNSLVGSAPDDFEGAELTRLANGDVVLSLPGWDNGGAVDAGAVMYLRHGDDVLTGTVSAASALVGESAGDGHGLDVLPLATEGFLALWSRWNLALTQATDAGAAAFVTNRARVGAVSASNALVGTSTGDRIGFKAVALSNGGYVVSSPLWNEPLGPTNAGAATFGKAGVGVTGFVSELNSLLGSSGQDRVGETLLALPNGNYVVGSPDWSAGGAMPGTGAVTFGNGESGTVGRVSLGNSLVGAAANDRLGTTLVALATGDYVAASSTVDSEGKADVGAVVRGNGSAGTVGVVTAANAVMGSAAGDRVGETVVALEDGSYVILSPHWANGVGALTAIAPTDDGAKSVGPQNSLVGTRTGDITNASVTAAGADKFLALMPFLDHPDLPDAGGLLLVDASGPFGAVSPENAFYGREQGDFFGASIAWSDTLGLVARYPLANSPLLPGDQRVNAGAVQAISSGSPPLGRLSPANALYGHAVNARLGSEIQLFSSAAVFRAPDADLAQGSVTLIRKADPTVGEVSTSDTVFGGAIDRGDELTARYDEVRGQLVVGAPGDSSVTLLRPGIATETRFRNIDPARSVMGTPVRVEVLVQRAGNGAFDGAVRVSALETGEFCESSAFELQPTGTQAVASCEIVFWSAAQVTLVAEYLDSVGLGYSASDPAPHTVTAPPGELIFADGFEGD